MYLYTNMEEIDMLERVQGKPTTMTPKLTDTSYENNASKCMSFNNTKNQEIERRSYRVV